MTSVSYREFTGTGAQNYERYFVPAIAAPAAAELLRTADLRRGERVLDVACGTGLIARLAAAEVGPTGSVTGVDVAPDMIDVARAASARSAPAIEWHVGDAVSLPVPDESVDVVTCQLGLMFLDDRTAAISEMARVLTRGGRAAVTTPGPIQPAFEVMERAIVDHIGADLGGFVRAVFSMHDADEVGDLLSGAGLRDVSARVYMATLQLPAPADFLWQYINLTPMAPFVAAASDEAKAAMERQMIDGWAGHVVNGSMPVRQPMVIATGTTWA